MKRLDYLRKIDQVPAPILLKSVQHCHIRHLSSIVIGVHNHCLQRIYLAWPQHQLVNNDPSQPLAVGIHDHRYDLQFTPLYGDIIHSKYQLGSGYPLKHWLFQSGEMQQQPTQRDAGEALLHLSSSHVLTEESLAADELHLIHCHGVAAWLVTESPVKKNITHLYTNTPKTQPNTYQRFDSVDAVIAHIQQFLALLN